jgi:hypothetical protein
MDPTWSPFLSMNFSAEDDEDNGELLTGDEPIFHEEEAKKVANTMMEKSGTTTSTLTVTLTTTTTSASKEGGEGRLLGV